MRLDHLLSREYEKRFGSITDPNGVVVIASLFEEKYYIVLKVQQCTFKRANGRNAGTPWGCSSAGRAPALQAGGHRFEPVHLHHFFFGGSAADRHGHLNEGS